MSDSFSSTNPFFNGLVYVFVILRFKPRGKIERSDVTDVREQINKHQSEAKGQIWRVSKANLSHKSGQGL